MIDSIIHHKADNWTPDFSSPYDYDLLKYNADKKIISLERYRGNYPIPSCINYSYDGNSTTWSESFKGNYYISNTRTINDEGLPIHNTYIYEGTDEIYNLIQDWDYDDSRPTKYNYYRIDINPSNGDKYPDSLHYRSISYDDDLNISKIKTYNTYDEDSKEGIFSKSFNYNTEVHSENIALPINYQNISLHCKNQIMSYENYIIKSDANGEAIGEYVGRVDYYISQKDFLDNTEDIDMISAVSIYPNPAENYITCRFEENNALISIYDINGKLCISRNITNEAQFNIGELTKGIYICKIKTTNSVHVKKFMKK